MDNDQLSYDEVSEALEAMLGALADIRETVFGTTFSDFLDDRHTVLAVLEGFDTLSVNVGRIPRDIRADHPEVAWRRLENLSTDLSDEFREVDLDAVWEAANELDTLQDALTVIRDRLDEYC